MNKQDFFTLIIKKRFRHKPLFRTSILLIDEVETAIQIKWIWDHKNIEDYIAPLKNWTNIGFLVAPNTNFTTRNFSSNVDIIAVNSGLEIKQLFENVQPNQKVNYQDNFLSTIILPHRYIEQFKLKQAQRIKLKKYKKTSNSWLENY